MKRIIFIIAIFSLCLSSVAQKKVDTMDDNKWGWFEESDKYKSVGFDGEGHLVLTTNKMQKHVSPYAACAKTFAQLPMKGDKDYKLTIKCISYVDENRVTKALFAPVWKAFKAGPSIFSVFFNTNRKCLNDEEGEGQFSTCAINILDKKYEVVIGPEEVHKDNLPGKFKFGKNHPVEFTITKQSQTLIIEINGIQIFKGKCNLTESCIGFMAPLKQVLLIDEVIIEQTDDEED